MTEESLPPKSTVSNTYELKCLLDSVNLNNLPEPPQKRMFTQPNIRDIRNRWINRMSFYIAIEARGAITEYYDDHGKECSQAVQQQLKTGENQGLIEYIQKGITYVENKLNKLGLSYVKFEDFQKQEIYRQRYESDEGLCVHDSLYNTIMAGFSRAAFLTRDGKGPKFVQVFMVEEEGNTSNEYNPDSELRKPLNQRVLGRGLYHTGLKDPPHIAQRGSEWHNLLRGAFDENLPIGIIPGYGDDSELRSASPRAILTVQNHGTDLDAKVIRDLQIHAKYVAERIMPFSSDYLLNPKP